jgi:hypothetical protein
MNLIFRSIIVLACLLGISTQASQLAVGDAVPAISAKDQFGKEFNYTNGLQFLLIAKEMGCSKSANLKLAEQGQGYLEKHEAAYLVNIHTMPAVARLFAFPKMRKYPYRIVLIEKAETLAVFPSEPDKVTVLTLTKAGRIGKISYWDPAKEPVAGYLQ